MVWFLTCVCGRSWDDNSYRASSTTRRAPQQKRHPCTPDCAFYRTPSTHTPHAHTTRTLTLTDTAVALTTATGSAQPSDFGGSAGIGPDGLTHPSALVAPAAGTSAARVSPARGLCLQHAAPCPARSCFTHGTGNTPRSWYAALLAFSPDISWTTLPTHPPPPPPHTGCLAPPTAPPLHPQYVWYLNQAASTVCSRLPCLASSRLVCTNHF